MIYFLCQVVSPACSTQGPPFHREIKLFPPSEKASALSAVRVNAQLCTLSGRNSTAVRSAYVNSFSRNSQHQCKINTECSVFIVFTNINSNRTKGQQYDNNDMYTHVSTHIHTE